MLCVVLKFSVFVLGFLLCFHTIDVTETAGSFINPDSFNTSSDERINEIQINLLRVQTEILNLNTALLSSHNTYAADLKARLSNLEEEFERLNKKLLDRSRVTSADSGKYDEAITRLTNLYNALDTQLKALSKLMDQKKQEEANRRLPTDVADEIRSHHFAVAESLLLRMADNRKVPKIVKDVYANSQGNFDVLLDFAKSLTNTDLSFQVISTLRYEMRSNGHRNPYKMISLVNALENNVIRPGPTSDIRDRAQVVIDETVSDIESVITDTLKSAMYTDSYQKNVIVERLVKALYDFRPDISDNVLKRIISETYPTVSAVKIADNMFSNTYATQKVSGLVVLFRKLESSKNLNDNAVLRIGDYLRRITKSSDSENFSRELKRSYEAVIERMPTCARNIFFSPFGTVCIWNKDKEEYLYAAASHYKYDVDRRRILTWTPGGQVNQGVWYVENDGDKFYFKNQFHSNEYLYAAGVSPYDDERRYVFTWINGGTVEDKSAWNIELDGDECYLKNEHYDEYLYAAVAKFMSDRRYVFTWIPKTSTHQPEFKWRIESCE